jgi:hypothetical protein
VLSREDIDARMEAYDEAIGHLDQIMDIPPNLPLDEQGQAVRERNQRRWLAKHLRKEADDWYKEIMRRCEIRI